MRKATTVVAALCVVLAVSSGAFAAKGLLTGANIKNGSLTGVDVKAHTLSANLFAASAIRSLAGKEGPRGVKGADGANGAAGLPGATGSVGATGATGASGAAGLGTATHTLCVNNLTNAVVSFGVSCTAGQTAYAVVTG